MEEVIVPDYRAAFVDLLTEEDGYTVLECPLSEWSDDDLLTARAYIGRELSSRELARREEEAECES